MDTSLEHLTSQPPSEFRFESTLGRGQEIYDVLEAPKNWAPWLRFSARQFDGQARARFYYVTRPLNLWQPFLLIG